MQCILEMCHSEVLRSTPCQIKLHNFLGGACSPAPWLLALILAWNLSLFTFEDFMYVVPRVSIIERFHCSVCCAWVSHEPDPHTFRINAWRECLAHCPLTQNSFSHRAFFFDGRKHQDGGSTTQILRNVPAIHRLKITCNHIYHESDWPDNVFSSWTQTGIGSGPDLSSTVNSDRTKCHRVWGWGLWD